MGHYVTYFGGPGSKKMGHNPKGTILEPSGQLHSTAHPTCHFMCPCRRRLHGFGIFIAELEDYGWAYGCCVHNISKKEAAHDIQHCPVTTSDYLRAFGAANDSLHHPHVPLIRASRSRAERLLVATPPGTKPEPPLPKGSEIDLPSVTTFARNSEV